MENQNKKRNWEILYSKYEGIEKKAIELLNKEMSALITRDSNVYTFHTLTVKKATELSKGKNVVVIGVYDENLIIRNFIKKEEIKENGYVVKVMKNPKEPDLNVVIITANESINVFYGVVDFVDDYFSLYAYRRTPDSSLVFCDELFLNPLPDYYNSSAPVIKTRNIFTWGHPINDYREYIDNMARLRFNQLIIWNDFVPLNAKDIVSYAHEYGISLIWGFAWGWSRHCEEIDFENLDGLTNEIVEKYENEYAHTGADGIYFQSFTELKQEYIGEKLIAQCVTDFVNKTANELLKKHPKLLIQFGLHATSVKEQLQFIKNVDKRVDIIWEDCGEFPHSYSPKMIDKKEYVKTENFTNKIINLRENTFDGVLYKGCLTLDWVGDYFVHQSGPYIMGMESKKQKERDLEVIEPLWKEFQINWLTNGKYAYDMTNLIKEKENFSIGIAGQLTGGMWFPPALISQILWECDKPYEEILNKVLNRRSVKMV